MVSEWDAKDGKVRFNEAIDEALTASMVRFTRSTDRYRDQFIGVLGHDLRTPLGAIAAGASLLTMPGGDDAQRARVGGLILKSALRMGDLIANLMDLTRLRLGSGMFVERVPADLGALSKRRARAPSVASRRPTVVLGRR